VRMRLRGMLVRRIALGLWLLGVPLLSLAISMSALRASEVVSQSRTYLQTEVLAMRDKVSAIEYRDLHRTSPSRVKYAVLDPASHGYDISISEDGLMFFVACDNIALYSDGERATLAIANPYQMPFDGFRIDCWYGPRGVTLANDRKRSYRMSQLLGPGRWTVVYIVLPERDGPCGRMEIVITPDLAERN
jgi:hypothetical protein